MQSNISTNFTQLGTDNFDIIGEDTLETLECILNVASRSNLKAVRVSGCNWIHTLRGSLENMDTLMELTSQYGITIVFVPLVTDTVC